MYVRNRMVTDVITIFPDASISLAYQIMVEKHCSQIPVVKDGKLVGLITEQALIQFSPSKATTLSMFELNYILSKTNCKEIMLKRKDVFTCTSDMLIEEAAIIINRERVNSLPVVDENDRLVGIITKTDIIAAFIEIIGTNDFGTRIAIETKDELGTIASISSIIKDYNVSITHIANYFYKDNPSNGEIIIRLNTLDTDALIKHLNEEGYKVLSVKKHE